MTYINTITDSPSQSMTLQISTGINIAFNIWYSDENRGWYFSFTYGAFSVNNQRVVAGVNMLRKFRNILPFGFAVITSDNYEPVFIDDFTNGRAQFFLLDATDVATAETMLQGAQVNA